MDVSKNRGTPKSSILIGFFIINHPFWGTTIFGNTHIIDFVSNNSKQVLPRNCSQLFSKLWTPSLPILPSGEPVGSLGLE